MKPKPWPEGTYPTAEQLADWIETCTREERVLFANDAINNARFAAQCFMEAHHGRIAHLEGVRRRLAEFVDGLEVSRA